MKISSQEEYGLRCLVQVARGLEDSPVPISEIALSEGLSVEYVGKLLMKLRKGGLVDSVRGKAGGYVLSRPPADISMRDAIAVLSESGFEPHDCDRFPGGESECVHRDSCEIRPVWSLMTKFLSEALSRVSLADIIEGKMKARTTLQESLPGIASDLSC